MANALIISFCISIFLAVLSVIFKIAGKLRLSIPLIYLVAAVLSTFFTDWTTQNEQLVLRGLYILIGLVVLSWLYSLIKTIKNKVSVQSESEAIQDYMTWQLQKAREQGINIQNTYFDESGHLHDKETGEQLQF